MLFFQALAAWAQAYNSLLFNLAIQGVCGLSLYITLMAGQLSLANAGFFLIGAYTAAISSKLGFGYPWDLLLVALLSAVTAVVVGLPALRLRGVYLALATLGFGEVVAVVARNLVLPRGCIERACIANGAVGVFGVPRDARHWHVYLVLALLGYFFYRLERSRVGRALAAIREDELVAGTMGINATYYKVLAFGIGAVIAGIAGGMWVHFNNQVDPRSAGFTQAINFLAYAVIGGTTTFVGPLVGAVFLYTLPEALRFLRDYRLMTVGLLLALAAVFAPRGILDPALWRQFSLRRPAPQPAALPRRQSDAGS
ncbi:MAG: branched-chain amino acid ABC transporter permease [Deinococcus sp.]|nr:branched-chain amino acid ABC transporter permease [Deinococcus sp.]